MRPAVAFAIGLWSGGLLVGAVWVFHARDQQPNHEALAVVGAVDTAAEPEEMRQLRQDNARLTAETLRLKQTTRELLRQADLLNGWRDSRDHRRLTPTPAPVDRPIDVDAFVAGLDKLATEADPAGVELLVRLAQETQNALLAVFRTPDLDLDSETLILDQVTHQRRAWRAEVAEEGQ